MSNTEIFSLGVVAASHTLTMETDVRPVEGEPKTEMGKRICLLIKQGCSQAEIIRETGASRGTISYHRGRLGLKRKQRGPDPGSNFKYDWSIINEAVRNGMTIREITKVFGPARRSIGKAIKRGDIILPLERRRNLTASEYSEAYDGIAARPHFRRGIRKKLVKEGTEYRCSECGIKEWNDKFISLEVDHIDGNTSNNDLSNLRLLCPNCHSQTNTWRGRNTKLAKEKRYN